MRLPVLPAKFACCLILPLLFYQFGLAHNGAVAYAYPLGNIVVDGNFSDWPATAVQYPVAARLSETGPRSGSDYTGFFRIGYRLENRSLYIALTITDDDFIEDTGKNVQYNTQDGVELCLDARHLPIGSGVASFMYSKSLRNINNAYFDSFAKTASWDIMEVVMVRQGNTRLYEWRIALGEQLVPGRSVGIDMQVFDKDGDGSFTFAGWGKGTYKFRNPNSLGDVVFLPAGTKMATVRGNIRWDRDIKQPLPDRIMLTAAENPTLWIDTTVDSTGNYQAEVPVAAYTIDLPDIYFQRGDVIYQTLQQERKVTAKAGQQATAAEIIIPGLPVPDLLPEKGLLHNFDATQAKAIDNFIVTYQKYYQVPGVSLALIKDGKMIYHKTYGLSNVMTGAAVTDSTLFEAASVTKPVFAYTVLRLAERGIIDLDKPLYLYLPYPDIAYDDRYKLITARHVLTHRTGFPNWRYMNPDGKLNILFTPGTDFNYSGEGFEYLKLVVEKITGKKVEEVLKEEVVTPLGLYHTFFSRNDSLQRMVAQGHFDMIPNYDALPESPGMAYSMHTEAAIFTRFMLQLMNEQGLSTATYDNMFRKQSDYKYDADEEKPPYPTYMGMSLEIRETPFGKTFGHGGNNGDFRCHFEVYKDLKMGYVIFTNSNTSVPLLQAMRKLLVEGK